MIEAFQQIRPAEAPRKKFRGKRAYFRRVLATAESFQLRVTPDAWWDRWHYHADWPGYGNLGWKYRKQHLEALFMVFNHCAKAMKSYPHPFQLWFSLSGRDAGEDAVYLHTRNPNNPPVPLITEDVSWGRPDVEAVFEPLPVRAGIVVWEGDVFCRAYVPGIGVSLEEDEVLRDDSMQAGDGLEQNRRGYLDYHASR